MSHHFNEIVTDMSGRLRNVSISVETAKEIMYLIYCEIYIYEVFVWNTKWALSTVTIDSTAVSRLSHCRELNTSSHLRCFDEWWHVRLPTHCVWNSQIHASLLWLLWGWLDNMAVPIWAQTINASSEHFPPRHLSVPQMHSAQWANIKLTLLYYHCILTVAAHTVHHRWSTLQHRTAWLPSFLSIKFPWQWNARAGKVAEEISATYHIQRRLN